MDKPGRVDYQVISDPSINPQDSDVYVLRVAREVAVTPISLDLTSRVGLDEFERYLRSS
jgi:hypothetical protein